MKQWEQLTDTCGIYRSSLYPVHEDALRLAEFFRCRPIDRILDCGTGNGILSVYASSLHGGSYTGIDLDETALSFARESAERNGQPITFFRCAVADAPSRFGHGSFDRILMNPPYYTTGDAGSRALSRHADPSLLGTWLHSSFLLLKNGGTLAVCYPSDQLSVLFRELDQNRLTPKRMKILFHGDQARLILLEAKKLGGPGLVIEKN